MALLLWLPATLAAAGSLRLGLPIDCTLNETCHIQQFTDRDPGPGARDFTCGPLSYDGHKGTDFALPSLRAMRAGVDVLAAAPGTIIGMRDGMADRLAGPGADAQIDGRDCGNGVVIDHGDGWQTQYCHMAQGSVAVRRGDRVAMGAVLGRVGLSGRTQFPHLHLSVRRHGAVVDPFAPEAAQCGAAPAGSLWITAPDYVPGGLLGAGFGDAVPTLAAIRAGDALLAAPGPDLPALVLWGYAFGARRGDVIALHLSGPAGRIVDHRARIDRDQAQLFRAAGKKRPARGWPRGRYSGTVEMRRAGAVLGRREVTLILE